MIRVVSIQAKRSRFQNEKKKYSIYIYTVIQTQSCISLIFSKQFFKTLKYLHSKLHRKNG